MLKNIFLREYSLCIIRNDVRFLFYFFNSTLKRQLKGNYIYLFQNWQTRLLSKYSILHISRRPFPCDRHHPLPWFHLTSKNKLFPGSYFFVFFRVFSISFPDSFSSRDALRWRHLASIVLMSTFYVGWFEFYGLFFFFSLFSCT